nr:ABC transporter ATP-binding protein [Desulfovibrio inopinatus]
MDNIFELRNLKRYYSGRCALDLEHFDIARGSILGVAGHNGSGKSTLMRMLALLETPDEGRIIFDGAVTTPKDSAARLNITLLTQEPYLLKRSVLANVAYGLKVRGISGIRDKAAEAMEKVGLSPDVFLSRSWRELSGGEAQRVALAARLVLRPKVLLLDEPTASLDLESTKRIVQAALAARDEWGTTIIVVSHDMEYLDAMTDNRLVLARGCPVESATV